MNIKGGNKYVNDSVTKGIISIAPTTRRNNMPINEIATITDRYK